MSIVKRHIIIVFKCKPKNISFMVMQESCKTSKYFRVDQFKVNSLKSEIWSHWNTYYFLYSMHVSGCRDLSSLSSTVWLVRSVS